MLRFIGLLLVAASLWFWLSVLYRGGWITVVRSLLENVTWVFERLIDYIYILSLSIGFFFGICRLDLSAIAVAMVLYTAVQLLAYVRHRFDLVKLFDEFISKFDNLTD